MGQVLGATVRCWVNTSTIGAKCSPLTHAPASQSNVIPFAHPFGPQADAVEPIDAPLPSNTAYDRICVIPGFFFLALALTGCDAVAAVTLATPAKRKKTRQPLPFSNTTGPPG